MSSAIIVSLTVLFISLISFTLYDRKKEAKVTENEEEKLKKE